MGIGGAGGAGGGEPSPLVLKRVEGHGQVAVGGGGGHVPKHLSTSIDNRGKGVRKGELGGSNPYQATPISKHQTLKSALARDGWV